MSMEEIKEYCKQEGMTQQYLFKKIEELEKHQKEQAKVLDDIEDRLSNLEYK